MYQRAVESNVVGRYFPSIFKGHHDRFGLSGFKCFHETFFDGKKRTLLSTGRSIPEISLRQQEDHYRDRQAKTNGGIDHSANALPVSFAREEKERANGNSNPYPRDHLIGGVKEEINEVPQHLVILLSAGVSFVLGVFCSSILAARSAIS